jgi:hypothetical protein
MATGEVGDQVELVAEEGSEDAEDEGEEPRNQCEEVVPEETVESEPAGVKANWKEAKGKCYKCPCYWLYG